MGPKPIGSYLKFINIGHTLNLIVWTIRQISTQMTLSNSFVIIFAKTNLSIRRLLFKSLVINQKSQYPPIERKINTKLQLPKYSNDFKLLFQFGIQRTLESQKKRESQNQRKKQKQRMAGLVKAAPLTYVVHVLAVACAVMVLVWCIHFRGGLAWEATNKSLIFNVCSFTTF